MQELDAHTTYSVRRVFPRRTDGSVMPSGENIRFDGKNYAAYIRPCSAAHVGADVDLVGVRFRSRLAIIWNLFEDGNIPHLTLDIVEPNGPLLRIVGTVEIGAGE